MIAKEVAAPSVDAIKFLSQSTLRLWLSVLTKAVFVLETDFDVEAHGEDVHWKGGHGEKLDRTEDIAKAHRAKANVAAAIRHPEQGLPIHIVSEIEEIFNLAAWDAEMLGDQWADCPSQRPIPVERCAKLRKMFAFFAHQAGVALWAHEQHKQNITRLWGLDMRAIKKEYDLTEAETEGFEGEEDLRA